MPRTANWVPSPDEIDWSDPINNHSPQTQGLIGAWAAVASPGQTTVRGLWQRRDGTAAGATPIVATPDSEMGWAWAMNGTDQYFNLGAITSRQLVGFTITAWLKTSNAGTTCVICDDNSLGTRAFQMQVTGGKIRFFFLNQAGVGGADLTGTITVSDGNWHHAAATWDGVTLRIYIDGVLDSSVASTVSAMAALTSNTLIGAVERTGPGNFLPGSIASAQINELALPPGVIYQMWAHQTRWDWLQRLERRVGRKPVSALLFRRTQQLRAGTRTAIY